MKSGEVEEAPEVNQLHKLTQLTWASREKCFKLTDDVLPFRMENLW